MRIVVVSDARWMSPRQKEKVSAGSMIGGAVDGMMDGMNDVL